jgi:lysyl-tRNA synthetase class 2
MAYNPSSTIAALRSVLQTYGRKPDMLARIPEIPLRIVDGKEMIAPAQAWERVNNIETPQLYAVFPWRMYGVGKEGLEIARNTYLYDPDAQKFRSHIGWKQDNIWAACLGMTKALRPLPDKFHGMTDQEQKYRQRYVDLITDDAARARFRARSKAVSSIREFMIDNGFLEVETPMLHPIPGGANAKPFITHHNALDQEMFLRIAPELYLKRLLVGGFERVFEINRNFRNEGISVRHNPEFTMMEFYAAYWNHHDLMDFTENLLRQAAIAATGAARVTYAGKEVHLDEPFARLSVRDSLVVHAGLSQAEADDADAIHARLKSLGEEPPKHWGLAQLQFGLFEAAVEEKLWQPTFIIDYPVEVSPLARASDTNPAITERFELFIKAPFFSDVRWSLFLE